MYAPNCCWARAPKAIRSSAACRTSRTAPQKPSRRAEAERLAAEEDAYNPAKALGLWEDEQAAEQAVDGAEDDRRSSGAPWGSGRVQRASGRRKPGPDTGPGLAYHWREVVSAQPWAFGIEANVKALASHFAKLKQGGLTPDELRAMSELYATTEGLRNPRALAWQDFIGKRALLIDAVRKAREAQDMQERPEEVYDGWDGPAEKPAADEWTW